MVNWDRLCKALVYATAMSDPYVFSYYIATRPRDERRLPEWETRSSETCQRRVNLRPVLSGLASKLTKLLSFGSSRMWREVLSLPTPDHGADLTRCNLWSPRKYSPHTAVTPTLEQTAIDIEALDRDARRKAVSARVARNRLSGSPTAVMKEGRWPG